MINNSDVCSTGRNRKAIFCYSDSDTRYSFSIRSDLLQATFISQHLYSSTKKLITFLIPTRFLRAFHWLLFAVRIHFLILKIIITIGLYLTNICKLLKSTTDTEHLCSCIHLQTVLKCYKCDQIAVPLGESLKSHHPREQNYLLTSSLGKANAANP